MQSFKQSLIAIFVGLVMVAGISFAASWVGPTASPPGNNAEAPINVGPVDQVKTYETDGSGNLIPGKSGGLMLGTFISRFTTLLAKDNGNVGIGIGEDGELPQAKLHVDGGDAIFEGVVQIKGGLPKKNKVLTSDDQGWASWQNLDIAKMMGSVPIYLCPPSSSNCSNVVNACKDGLSLLETCTSFRSYYNPRGGGSCGSESVKTCKLIGYLAASYNTHTYTGSAIITNIDHDGNHEYCWVDVNFSGGGYSCSRSYVQSPNLNELSLSKCNDWLLRAIRNGEFCALPFPQSKISAFSGAWNMKTSQDFGEGWVANGTGALDLTFKVIQ